MKQSATQGPPRTRSGITVLEVLISIGILAVGLTSVLALVPAAKSQSARAVILDRAAVLAANVLADASTCGLLRSGTECFMVQSGGSWIPMTARPPFMVIDPLGATLATGTNVAQKNTGIYGGGTTRAPDAFHRLFLQSRDDVVVVSGTGDDSPTNAMLDGTRPFEGRMTSLLCLAGPATGLCRASVVVFYGRDAALIGSGVAGPYVTGTLLSGTLTLQTPDLGDRTVSQLIRPGVVINISGTLHQLTAANVAVLAATPAVTTVSAFLASAKQPVIDELVSPGLTIQILPDSVGLAERLFTPESPGPFSH